MKLGSEKRLTRLRSSDVLGEVERGKSLAESLEFVRAGDKRLLEKILQFDDVQGIVRADGYANLLLVFNDLGVSAATLESRSRYIDPVQRSYEEGLVRAEAGVPAASTGIIQDARKLLLLNEVLKEPLTKPSDQVWEQMVSWIKEKVKTGGGSTTAYSYLLALDPERFLTLDLSAVKVACLKAIDLQRLKQPLTNDNEHLVLLSLLAHTRLIFPDLIGLTSLKPEERRALYAYLNNKREHAQKLDGGGGSQFINTYIELALVEAHRMTVDGRGIHLFGDQGPIQQLAPLPERLQLS